MGSFLDSAVANYGSAIPTSTDSEERAKQWEAAHQQMDRWQRDFSLATIKVGMSLIKWCENHGGLTSNGLRVVERWIEDAKRYLEGPYRPLDQVGIECLEHNVQFMRRPES